MHLKAQCVRIFAEKNDNTVGLAQLVDAFKPF